MYSARRILKTVPGVSFNIFQKVLMGPLGYRFLEDARATNRLVFVWTVNRPPLMRWCIRRGVDGVITDDPDSFRQLCERWPEEDIPHRDEDRIGFREGIVLMLVTWLFRFLFWAIGPELLQKLLLRRTVLLKARVKDAGKKK